MLLKQRPGSGAPGETPGNLCAGLSAGMDKLLNVAELAQVLGITPKAVYCRLHAGRQSVPTPLLIPGSSHLRWRQSDVEAWLAVLPTRTAGRTPPRHRRGKAPTLVGEAAVWEKYRGL